MESLGIRDNLRLARWLLSQGDELQAMLGYAQAFREGEKVRQKWEEGLRPAGDMGVTIVESYPAAEAQDVATMAAIESIASTKGIDAATIAYLVSEFLPLVLELVAKLRR